MCEQYCNAYQCCCFKGRDTAQACGWYWLCTSGCIIMMAIFLPLAYVTLTQDNSYNDQIRSTQTFVSSYINDTVNGTITSDVLFVNISYTVENTQYLFNIVNCSLVSRPCLSNITLPIVYYNISNPAKAFVKFDKQNDAMKYWILGGIPAAMFAVCTIALLLGICQRKPDAVDRY
jgi:hypothetical protein